MTKPKLIFTRKYVCVVICFCTVTTVLLVLWNFNKRDDLYVKVLNTYENEVKTLTVGEDVLYNLKFKYIINSATCQRSNHTQHLAVIVVTSYIANVERRSSMRRALPDDVLAGFGLRRVFLLGYVENDPYIKQESVEDESKRFDDIVQGNFKEAYRNLTYKHIMGLRWVPKFCTNVKYVIKMDDDIVFDIHRTMKLIEGLKLPSENYIGGYVLKCMVPIREPANKWYTTLEEYGASRYPTFVSGWFYITTLKFCRDLALQSSMVPYFWIDDVYVTGILGQRLGVRFLNLNRYYAVHSELMQCCLQDLDRFQCDFLVGPNGGDDDMFFRFNELADNCFEKKCSARSKPLNVSCVVSEKDVALGRGNAVVQSYKLR